MEKRVFFKGWKLPLLLVTPQLIISAVFFFYPSGQAIWNSLFLPDPFGLKTEFVGLDNFRFLLSDSYYLASFKTTIIFSVAVTISSMLIGLYLAALADRLIKGSGVYQTLLIWPYAIAPAIAGVLWLFLFNGNIGLVSWYLKGLGYEWNHNLNGDQAMFLVVLASAWGRISYNFLFFFAGLQAIPKSILEAAAIDGAGRMTTFFKVTLPLLWENMRSSLVFITVLAMDMFGITYTMTQGGPDRATDVLATLLYEHAFLHSRFGYATSIAMVYFIIVIILSLLIMKMTRRETIEF